MRIKIAGLLLFLLLLGEFSFSQTTYPFPQSGLEQTQVYVGDWTTGFHVYNQSFKYIGDSVVGAYTYARLEYLANPSNYYHTFYDSGKVYYFHPGESLINPYAGTLLYDFSLVTGDSIQLYNSGSVYFHVNYTIPQLLSNGQTRKAIVFTEGFVWIDGIGDRERGFTYSEGGICGGYEELVCQKDTSGLVYSNPGTIYQCDIYEPILLSDTVSCPPFTFVIDVVGETCYGSCDGTITITFISGGTGPVIYSIDGGAVFQAGGTFTGLCSFMPGYNLVICDGSFDCCSMNIYVPVESSLAVNIDTLADVSCYGFDDGLVCLQNYGGSAPFVYSISTGETNAIGCFNDLPPGIFNVCITDANGCEVCDTITISEPTQLSYTLINTPASCDTCCNGDLQITPTGGTPPYTVNYLSGPMPTPNNFCVEDYIYCITDTNGCQICDTASITYPLSIIKLSQPKISIYPNPANTSFIFETNVLNSQLEITDVIGKLIYDEKIIQSKTEIKIDQLVNGVYNLKYFNQTRKLIIQH